MLVPVRADEAKNAEYWRVEAKRLSGDLVAARARTAELEALVGVLKAKVATLTKLIFGASSEKKPKHRAKPAAPGPGAGTGTGGCGRRRRGQQPGSRGHGRRDYSGLDTEEEIHDVPAQERACPDCGAAYVAFGEERSEQVDWVVRIVRIVHRRRRYRRSCGCAVPGVLVGPVPPKPIAKGRFTARFLARVVVDKYVLGRPLERIVSALSHDGAAVAPGTLVGNLKAVSALLAPLAGAIGARNGAAGHLHVDETSWSVFEAVADKANNRWWLWVFVGPDTTVFTIAPSRSTKVLTSHLGIEVDAGSLAAGRSLVLSSDFFSVYQSLATVEGVDPLYCWAHIRRYFIRAGDAHKELAAWTAAWLERIGALYGAHRALAAARVGSACHRRAAEAFTAALGAIDAARTLQTSSPELLHPAAAKVLATLDHEWEGLARHRELPELPLDNNAAERALRGPVVGRKNYYGSGSVWAAELSGRVWTITATAARAGCNPLTYLCAYLDACATAGGRPPPPEVLARFLPWAASAADLDAWRVAPGGPAP